MWFDARAALESIGGGAHPAPVTPGQRNSQHSQDSRGWETQSTKPQTQRDRGQFAEFAEFATPLRPNPVPLTDAARKRAAALPTQPPTCAACGVADWHVFLTDTNRRKLHVACWRAEQEGKA